LGVVFALPTTTADAIALPTRWPYSIVLTIVHIDGTPSYPSTISFSYLWLLNKLFFRFCSVRFRKS
jgi:hypothetical protein